MKRGLVRRVLKGIAVTLGFAFLVGIAFLYWAFRTGRAVEAVRQEIAVELEARCGVEAEFTTLTIDPFARELVLDDLSMRHQGGDEIIAVEEAIVRLDLLPLFYGRLQLDRVAMLRPRVRIELVDGVPVNLPDCVKPKGETSAPIVLGISELRVERGEMALAVDHRVEIEVEDIGISLTPGTAGGVDIALGTDVGRIVVDTATHTLSRVRLLGHLEGLLSRPRAVVLDRVEVGVGRVTAAGSGSIDLLGPVYEAKLDLDLPLEAVEDFFPDVPNMSGDTALEVAVAGTFLDPRAAGKVRVERGRIDDFVLGDRVDVDFSVSRRGVELNAVRVEMGEGKIEGTGSMVFDEQLSFEVHAQATDLALARVLEGVGVAGAWANLRGDGTTTLSGSLQPVSLSGPFEYDLHEVRVFDGPWDASPPPARMLGFESARASGRWAFSTSGFEMTNLVVSSGATVGHADVGVRFEGGLDIQMSFPSFDFVDIGPVAGLGFGGFGTMSGEIRGPFESLVAVGAFDLADISVADIPFGSGTGTVRWSNLVDLEVSGIDGRLGQSHYNGHVGVKLEGEIPLVISGQVTSGRVQDLLVPFGVDGREWGDPTGRLYAKFDLEGPVTTLTGPIDMTVEDVEVLEEKIQRGRVAGRMDQGRVVVDDLELRKYEARIQGNGWIDPNLGNVRARLRTSGATLQSIDLLRTTQERLDGALAMSLVLGGSLMGVTGTVTAVLSDMKAGAVPLGDGRFDGKLRGATIEYVASALDRKISAVGTLGLGAKIPYTAQMVLNAVPAPTIVSGLQGHSDYRGSVTGTADLDGSIVDWHLSNGKLFLEQGVVDIGSVHLETSAPARFTMKKGVLETRRLSISGPRTRLTGEGRFGGDTIDMKVSGRIDLAIAELLSESVEKAGGNLVVDATLGGSPASPTLVGAGRIERGLLEWSGFENRVTGMTADLTFSQSTILIDRARGQWAGGRLDATGNVFLESYLPKRFTLNLAVKDASPRMSFPTVDLFGRMSGNIQIFGTPMRIKVRGDVDVSRGRARPKIDAQSLVGSKRIVDVYDPSKEVVDLDVHFHTKEPVRVKNDDADVELVGDLRLTGTNERYGLLGTTTVVQGGRVAFIGREYTMESGTIAFTDRYRIEADYDLLLSAQACQARIRLNLVGSFEEVRTTYSSNPEMDERDIVSCLIRGVKVTDLDRDLPSFAGSALLKLSGVDREVKKVLPIDQIDVTTEYSSQARGYEPRVLVAKDLSVLDRPARLEYSSSLLRTNDQRAALRVRLTPRLNVQFGWTSSEDVPYGDWGLDLKQRWEW